MRNNGVERRKSNLNQTKNKISDFIDSGRKKNEEESTSKWCLAIERKLKDVPVPDFSCDLSDPVRNPGMLKKLDICCTTIQISL